MTAPDAVLDLVERFARNREQYLNPAYNETQVRREFIDPLFVALGWDVDNTCGYAQAYKDVVHEDAIKIGLDARAPDYSFRIGGQRKFFVEAKKPAVNLKDDPASAYQLRRYAWSAKLPLSLLTDFQELAVYDCRVRPANTDKASVARTLYVPCEQYEERWEEIAGVFSKEAILQGSFDRYAESTKARKGTAEVDKAFLSEIELWRDALARNIAMRNPSLSQRELNYSVQATIDRLIFLRICEDRGIEPYGRLRGLVNGQNVYARLREIYVEADHRYNSGLFHFEVERGRADATDRLTLSLTIDDKPLKDILGRLYYPESPYEFSVLPADILGQVYEQFLGKVIRLTAGHRAVVEDKPEVKKAGGVYYTPTYIVDYIVEHTVGCLLEGKTVKQAAELRILDPACGSGSFLIGAYQYLVDWHLKVYSEHPGKHREELVQGRAGEWQLTTAEKKRILLANIYGVDIDAQAVETTKLSLLLKVLEGETWATIESQLSFLHERALPDLAANIKCGNSLIGSEFYDDQQLGLSGLDEEERYRINIFDWEAEFPLVLGGAVPEEVRGFDVVIGNPPYIRIQNLKEFAPREVEFYKRRYVSASKGNYDIYVVFVERGLSLLNTRGQLGYILPHKFMNAKYGEPLRGLLAAERHVADVVHFGHQQVFASASTYTCLLFLGRTGRDEVGVTQVDDLLAWRLSGAAQAGRMLADRLTSADWTMSTGAAGDLLARLRACPVKLSDVTDRIFQGIKTSGDAVYIVEELERVDGRVHVRSRATGQDHWLEPDLLHPLVKGGDSRRYSLVRTDRLILFPYELQGATSGLVSTETLENDLPLTWDYLVANRAFLAAREHGLLKGPDWYAYGRTQALDVMPLAKLFTPDLAPRAAFSWDPTGECFFTGGVAGGYGILPADGYEPEYLLGLLNSRLLDWVVKQTATSMRGGWYSFESRFIRDLPIAASGESGPGGELARERVVGHARQLLALSEQLRGIRTAQEAAQMQREYDALDSRLDRLVYDLYGLGDDEIALVEGV
jgi:type I restriction-modification system DNA methylase subunit/predicted type IV restriction endonuclease